MELNVNVLGWVHIATFAIAVLVGVPARGVKGMTNMNAYGNDTGHTK